LVPDDYPNPVDESLDIVTILVAERHFLRAPDEQVMAFASNLGRRCHLAFHLALDDPLLKVYAGEWLGPLLARLGMNEAQPIENAMIARRIKDAQDRFAKRVVDDHQADSAEEWLRLNVADGRLH
jgi:preprotein translocase subunit SecA